MPDRTEFIDQLLAIERRAAHTWRYSGSPGTPPSVAVKELVEFASRKHEGPAR